MHVAKICAREHDGAHVGRIIAFIAHSGTRVAGAVMDRFGGEGSGRRTRGERPYDSRVLQRARRVGATLPLVENEVKKEGAEQEEIYEEV